MLLKKLLLGKIKQRELCGINSQSSHCRYSDYQRSMPYVSVQVWSRFPYILMKVVERPYRRQTTQYPTLGQIWGTGARRMRPSTIIYTKVSVVPARLSYKENFHIFIKRLRKTLSQNVMSSRRTAYTANVERIFGKNNTHWGIA